MRLGCNWLVLVLVLLHSGCDGDGSSKPGALGVDPKEAFATSMAGGSKPGAPAPAALIATAKDVAPDDRRYVVGADLVDVTFEDVKLAADTVVTPSAALSASSGSVGTQTFDTASLGAAASKLEKGKVLLVPGRVLGKVKSVTTKGDTTVVETGFASLTDAFTDATIGWSGTLPIGEDNLLAMVTPDGRQLPVREPVMYAALPGHGLPAAPPAPMEWSLTDGKLTYSAKLDHGSNFVDLEVKVQRKMANTGGMAYTGKLRLKPIKATGDATIKGGKTRSLDIQQKDIGGDITLSLAAAGGGRSEISKDLPMPLLKWIVLVGPIPVVITARPRLIGRVDLPARGSSVATATFHFGGEAGFVYDGTKVEAKAAFPDGEFEIDENFDAAGFIGGEVDAQFGVAFPVVSMGMFDSFFMPELIPGAQLGARLTWGPACKTGYLQFTVKAAYDFQVLGVSLRQAKTTLFEKRKDSKGQSCRKK